MNKVVRTIEFSAALDAAVARLAEETKKSPAEIVTAAVEDLIAGTDDLAVELERWAEYERTGEALDEAEFYSAVQAMKARNKATLGS
ncbi:MAG: hypothetical protein ACKVRO_06225 [Micropepsaceae bacterium]